jgi:hypothetical protein
VKDDEVLVGCGWLWALEELVIRIGLGGFAKG